MIELIEKPPSPFALVQRAVVVTASWPSRDSDYAKFMDLLALSVLDAYRAERESGVSTGGPTSFVTELFARAEQAGVRTLSWTPEQAREFRSISWRAAHAFLVLNVNDVDRGPEIDALAAVLGVER